MDPAFAKKLSLVIQSINVGIQKIDSTTFKTYKIVVAAILVINQANRLRLFEETFLLANVNPDMLLRIFFFTLSGANIDFKRESFDRDLIPLTKLFLPSSKLC